MKIQHYWWVGFKEKSKGECLLLKKNPKRIEWRNSSKRLVLLPNRPKGLWGKPLSLTLWRKNEIVVICTEIKVNFIILAVAAELTESSLLFAVLSWHCSRGLPDTDPPRWSRWGSKLHLWHRRCLHILWRQCLFYLRFCLFWFVGWVRISQRHHTFLRW